MRAPSSSSSSTSWPGGRLHLDLVAPGGVAIDPGVDHQLVEPDGRRCDGSGPPVVAARAERRRLPAAVALPPPPHPRTEPVVTVGDELGRHRHPLARPRPWPGTRPGCGGGRRRSRSAAAQDQAYEPRHPHRTPAVRGVVRPREHDDGRRLWAGGDHRDGEGGAGRGQDADVPRHLSPGVYFEELSRTIGLLTDRRSTDASRGGTGSSGAARWKGATFDRCPDRVRGGGTVGRTGALLNWNQFEAPFGGLMDG